MKATDPGSGVASLSVEFDHPSDPDLHDQAIILRGSDTFSMNWCLHPVWAPHTRHRQ
jgi:hypothetical protein